MVGVGKCSDAHRLAMTVMMAGVSVLRIVACNNTTLSRGGRRRSWSILPDCDKCVFIYILYIIHAFSGRTGIPLIYVDTLLILNNRRISGSARQQVSGSGAAQTLLFLNRYATTQERRVLIHYKVNALVYTRMLVTS